MKTLGFALIFVLVAAGLIALASNDPAVGGVPSTGGPGVLSLLAPNPDAYEAQAGSYRALADLSSQRAQEARAWAAAATEERRNQIYAATQSVEQANRLATQAVETTRTQQAFEAALQLTRDQATAEMQITQTYVALDVSNQQKTATLDTLKLQVAQGKATQEKSEQDREEAWEDMKFQVAYKTSFVWVNWWIILLALLFFGAFGAGYELLRQRAAVNMKTIPTGPDGTHDGVVMGGKIHNVDIMNQSTIDPRNRVNVSPEDRQHEIARTYLGVQATRALARGGYRKDAYQAAATLAANSQQFPANPEPSDDRLPEFAPWDLTGWSKRTLPLGLAAGGQGIEVDPQTVPNLMIAGTTGSGKTMRVLRPLAAEMLASGAFVLILNPKGGDFAPFQNHPNLRCFYGDGEGGAGEEMAGVLEAVAREVKRRNILLRTSGVSTYEKLGNREQVIGPRIFVLIEEMVSLINDTPDRHMRERMWSAAVDIASRCRAMGMGLMFATTDPTKETLGARGLRVRDNCGRIIFRVRDQNISLVALGAGGAEQLSGAQFLAQLDTHTPVKGVAFHPQDQDITHFLDAHQVPPIALPPFLEAGLTAYPQPPIMVTPPPVGTYEPSAPRVPVATCPPVPSEIIALAEKIRPVWEAGGSKRAMATAAGFSQYGGSHAKEIDDAIAYLESQKDPGATTTTGSEGATEGQEDTE